jgi:hypothetical protein
MLPGSREEILRLLRPAEDHLMMEIFEIARKLCPVASGNLRDHLYARMESDGTIVVGDDADYAADVEYGHQIPAGSIPNKTAPTGHVPAQPFLRPAIYRTYGTIK